MGLSDLPQKDEFFDQNVCIDGSRLANTIEQILENVTDAEWRNQTRGANATEVAIRLWERAMETESIDALLERVLRAKSANLTTH